MVVATREILDRLRERAEADDDVAETLAFMVEGSPDPFTRPPAGVLAGALGVNARRAGRRRAHLADRSLTTAQVVEALRSISDRRGVDRRRQRRQLLGVRGGNTTWHPIWQFDLVRSKTRRGLPALLAALDEVTPDPSAADMLVLAANPNLDGRSIAEVFADGDVDLAVQAIRLAGDQS